MIVVITVISTMQAASMTGVESVLHAVSEAAVNSVVVFQSLFRAWIHLRHRAQVNCVATKRQVLGSVGSIIEIGPYRATKEAYPLDAPLLFLVLDKI